MNRSGKRSVILFMIAGMAVWVLLDSALAREKADQSKEAKGVAWATAAPPDYGVILNTLRFREIGPAAMGGRIDDFAVVESDPNIIYVGAASGGVFKTKNGGTTW